MIKIRVSYERPEQLKKVLDRLKPDILRHKEKKGRDGQRNRSYIDLRD